MVVQNDRNVSSLRETRFQRFLIYADHVNAGGKPNAIVSVHPSVSTLSFEVIDLLH